MEAEDRVLQLKTQQNKLKFREVKSNRTQIRISGSQIDAPNHSIRRIAFPWTQK